MTLNLKPTPPKRSLVAAAALRLAVFALLVTVYSAALLRTRSVQAEPGFGAFLSGLALAALATILGVAGLAVVWRTGRKGAGRAFAAIVIGAAVLGGPAYVAFKGLRAPLLGEVSTDLDDPPRFDFLARDRKPGDRPAPPPSIPPAQAEKQRTTYPDLKPLILDLPAEEAAELALGVVETKGWRVVGPTAYPRGGPPTGRIEAAARTPLLGIEEDVSIRVRADGDRSRVDVRAASRLGRLGFGSEAALVKSYLADLAAEANAAP